ncbi:MAG: TlpA family protein disulfide reductase, partial [Acetobacteraceae bacterium]|nr:TlpA family protein disulfide reductase [Acetobacteraceae bacterium]
VQTLDGKATDLARYYGRTPVLIEFWASWCPNCKALEPQLQRIAREHGAKVTLLGVAVSVNQTPQRAKLYAAKHGLPLEILFDRKGAATSAYNVFATSTIGVIDRTGTIVYTGQGADQDIEAAIKKAL